jgi:hypothetical protein
MKVSYCCMQDVWAPTPTPPTPQLLCFSWSWSPRASWVRALSCSRTMPSLTLPGRLFVILILGCEAFDTNCCILVSLCYLKSRIRGPSTYLWSCLDVLATWYVIFKLRYTVLSIAGLYPQVPTILYDNLQRKHHNPYGPPTSFTWLQLLHKQTNTGTSTTLTAETHWSTRTRLCALSRLVTSGEAGEYYLRLQLGTLWS